MKRITILNIVSAAVLLLAAESASAQAAKQQLFVTQRMTACEAEACGLPVTGVKVKRDTGLMSVSMDMHTVTKWTNRRCSTVKTNTS